MISKYFTSLGCLAFLAILGCQAKDDPVSEFPQHSNQPSAAASNNTEPTPTQDSTIQRDSDSNANEANLADDDPLPPPQLRLSEKTIELQDLHVVLKRLPYSPTSSDMTYFFMSETEITNSTYADYLAATSQRRDDSNWEKASKEKHLGTSSTLILIKNPASLWRNGDIPHGREQHPVSLITTEEGTHFCAWLNERYGLDGSFRLPTQEEWVLAAYGESRQFPWGDEGKNWSGDDTEPVHQRADLKTPDGIYGMWGNVSELVLSDSNGYGGVIEDWHTPMITKWLGSSYSNKGEKPRQQYWGYTHSPKSRSDAWGFRIVFIPDPQFEIELHSSSGD